MGAGIGLTGAREPAAGRGLPGPGEVAAVGVNGTVDAPVVPGDGASVSVWAARSGNEARAKPIRQRPE